MIRFVHPFLLVSLLFTSAMAGCGRDQPKQVIDGGPDETPRLAFYTVAQYDETRNPADDLRATIARATAEKKRIILQLGGDWCGWCKILTKVFESDARARQCLNDNFILMKVTVTKDQPNSSFLAAYPRP